MKFYLAAGFSRKNEMAEKAKQLQSMTIGVTSTWPWEDASPNASMADLGDEHLIVNGAKDIAEIDAADGVILFTQDPTIPFLRGGRMHEFGYAHGKGKRLIVCGPKENIFHYLPGVEVVESWEALLTQLGGENERP
jgi:nucleoside 2-deoxyribosyltransferase